MLASLADGDWSKSGNSWPPAGGLTANCGRGRVGCMARTQRSTRRITIWAELLMLAIGAVSPLSAAVLTNNIVYGPKFGSDAI